MGAIRAAEMHHMGLIPYGKVAAMFCEDPEFSDDEVTLIHGNEPPFFPFSEPMVHIREFVTAIRNIDLITEAIAVSIIYELKNSWYGDRTLERLQRLLQISYGNRHLPDTLLAAMKRFSDFRIKQQDLRSFVHKKPWRDNFEPSCGILI
jgi:hypothetical protein